MRSTPAGPRSLLQHGVDAGNEFQIFLFGNADFGHVTHFAFDAVNDDLNCHDYPPKFLTAKSQFTNSQKLLTYLGRSLRVSM